MIRNGHALEDFLGEEVVDMEGNPVGTLACFWERGQRNALLLGVDIPGLSGHTHVVPALGARCNGRQVYVEVAFSRDKIVQAPCLSCDCEVDGTIEERIWAFYAIPAPRPAASDSESSSGDVRGKQWRRIARPDPRPAHGATSPPINPPPGHVPPSPSEAQENKTQESPDE